MPAHSSLTGADLHEPKGVASASANTVYVANGSGSGSWVKVGTSQLNTSTVFDTNQETYGYRYVDIGTAGSKFMAISRAMVVNKIVVVLDLLTATANTILTFKNNAGVSMGTVTIPTGSTAGTVFTLSPASNNTFTADTKLQIDTDGGTSTASDVHISFNVTRTA